jgi:phosphoribosylamine-glycine ligase
VEQGISGTLRQRASDCRVGLTYGGRVLHVIAGDSTLERAREKAYRNIDKMAFVDHNNDGANCMRYRKTIGL